jgi:hypothetical protein
VWRRTNPHPAFSDGLASFLPLFYTIAAKGKPQMNRQDAKKERRRERKERRQLLAISSLFVFLGVLDVLGVLAVFFSFFDMLKYLLLARWGSILRRSNDI